LPKKINWDYLEESLYKFFIESIGRKTKSLRAMTAIIILQYMLNLSDDDIVAQSMENVYYQAFIGNPLFVNNRPCSPSTLTRFRKRIGQDGCELILQESVRIHGKKALEKDCIADITSADNY
jgi:IS5 family transposase